MKKLFAILLAAVLLACSLVSCGSKTINYMSDDLTPYVTAGQYKNLTVTYPAVDAITDEDVKDHVVDHIADMGDDVETVTDRACALGDVVNIDFVGSIDGVAFDGGSAEGTDLLLGSGTMIDGFEDGIVGMNVGETKTIDVTFPEDYDSEELAGKAAQFAITLNSIYAESLFADTRAELEASREEEIAAVKNQYAWTAVVNNATFVKYPEKVVNKLAEDLYAYYEMAYYSYIQYGLTLEMLGITEETCLESAQNTIKQELIPYSIVKANGYTVTDEQYNAKGTALATEYGITEDEYKNTYSRQSTETKVYYEKVMADVLATATFVEA